MIEVKENYKLRKDLDNYLRRNFDKALEDNKFRALINNLGVDEEVAMKYTSKLEETVLELKFCVDCKGLMFCKNKVEGLVNYPNVDNEKIVFSYVACKYKKKEIKEKENEGINSEINSASFANIDIEDKKRLKVIKWLKDFYKSYDKSKNMKGLYLHGSFGSGKSYLIAALFNELEKLRVRTEIVYYPELISDLKSDFDSYGDKLDYLKNLDLLLIDDIGAEKVTEWSRDEVLGTILQARMDAHLPTFFTSNLTLEELESHLSSSKNSDDLVKARRIIERIKQVSENISLISANRRN